ncbi:MAG: bacteriohemerythrin [Candidatus Omnitrophota bacterium]
MPHIAWDPSYSVNVAEIDQQHQKIVAMFKKLSSAIKQKNQEKIIPEVLRELDEYAEYHFNTEERLMRRYGYPDYEAHQKEHEDFCMKVSGLQRDLLDGKKTVTGEALKFLADWFSDHVKKTDKKYGPFLNEKGVY